MGSVAPVDDAEPLHLLGAILAPVAEGLRIGVLAELAALRDEGPASLEPSGDLVLPVRLDELVENLPAHPIAAFAEWIRHDRAAGLQIGVFADELGELAVRRNELLLEGAFDLVVV